MKIEFEESQTNSCKDHTEERLEAGNDAMRQWEGASCCCALA